MARRRTRTYIRRPLKTIKYSNETCSFSAPVSFAQGTTNTVNCSILHSTETGGTRKIKNISFATSAIITWGSTPIPILFAVIYVPEINTVNNPNLTLSVGSLEQDRPKPVSIYEPSQNVIMSGYIPTDNGHPIVYRSRLARNLNSGDNIYILFRPATAPPEQQTYNISCKVNYAICYN